MTHKKMLKNWYTVKNRDFLDPMPWFRRTDLGTLLNQKVHVNRNAWQQKVRHSIFFAILMVSVPRSSTLPSSDGWIFLECTEIHSDLIGNSTFQGKISDPIRAEYICWFPKYAGYAKIVCSDFMYRMAEFSRDATKSILI